VIVQARGQHRKELGSTRTSRQKPFLATVRDELGQVDYVVRRVLENREAGLPLNSQAVLFRAAHHSAGLEVELGRRRIPFVKYGGLRFLEAAHIKDVLAILRWAENPRDRVAAFRVLQLLPGIGPGTARKALAALEAASYGLVSLASFAPPPAAAERWPGLIRLLITLSRAPWPVQLGLVRQLYDPLLEELYDFPAGRRADLGQLERLAAASPSRQRFLTELTLDPPEAVGRGAGPPVKDEDYLVLSTIHSAKGQEWRAVFVLNCVDGCIPSDMATGSVEEIEEERRLLYVAMTRAKDELHLVVPQRFYAGGQARTGDRYVRVPRSRFVSEAMLGLFEITTGPGSTERSPAVRPPPRHAVDIAAGVRGMWE
jgi:DNA helicase-2/ATP-dependent DNA helicase PcrA